MTDPAPMVHESVRPLNDMERAELEKRIAFRRPAPEPLGRWQRFWSCLGFGKDHTFLKNMYDYAERSIPIWKEMLADGHVRVQRIRSKAVVELLDSEDEGNSYFFDVGEGRVFCYCFYQGPDEPSSPSDWPNDDFEVIQSRIHPGHYQRLSLHGSRIEPLRQIHRPFELWSHLPKTGENLIVATLDTIEDDLLKGPKNY
jgi:hypothetical protein